MRSIPPSRNRIGELQRLLGDAGEVLPRVAHGSPQYPAQGWYARLTDGKVHYLGDYSSLASQRIAQLLGGGEKTSPTVSFGPGDDA